MAAGVIVLLSFGSIVIVCASLLIKEFCKQRARVILELENMNNFSRHRHFTQNALQVKQKRLSVTV